MHRFNLVGTICRGAALLAIIAGPVAAAPHIVTSIHVDKTGRVSPGQVLTYTITARNTGNAPAHNVVVMDPIPRGAEYLPGSAGTSLARTEFSIDGGHSWSDLPLEASSDNGRTWHGAPAAEYKALAGASRGRLLAGSAVSLAEGDLIRATPPDRYTDVRWIISEPLFPGSRVAVSVKVTVR